MSNKKVSEMIIDVSGDLFHVVNNQQEMQAHLDLVCTAWNIAILSPEQKNKELHAFLKKNKKYAPSDQALKGLEWEMRRVIKQKERLYPNIKKQIVTAEAIERGKDDYTIRAYFEEDA